MLTSCEGVIAPPMSEVSEVNDGDSDSKGPISRGTIASSSYKKVEKVVVDRLKLPPRRTPTQFPIVSFTSSSCPWRHEDWSLKAVALF